MPELLFLTQRIPYPPMKGEKIRPLQILRFLRERYTVHLGSLIDDPADRQHVPVLQEMCGETYFATLDPRLARLACLRGLATGEPLSTLYFRNRGLMRWVADLLERRRPEAAFVCSSAMAQYLPPGPHVPHRLVMDFADVDSDKWRQYADKRGWPMRWIYRRESRVLLDYDRAIGRRVDAVTFVSRREAELFSRLAPELAPKSHPVSSGVDADYFRPDREYGNPYAAASGPVAVFTGTMNYWPNVDAVTWFATAILPGIRAAVGNMTFYIVGANPDAKVRALGGLQGVAVTGRVEDVRPFLAHASVVVAPLRVAGGVQNKVLEGMAMAKAVVATPRAIGGLDPAAVDGVIVAEDAASFADSVRRVVTQHDGARWGERARRRVLDLYDWQKNLRDFLPYLGLSG